MESHGQIQDWPIKAIVPHPQNRPVRKAPKGASRPARDWQAEERLWREKCKRLYEAVLARDIDVYQGLAVAILLNLPFRSQPKDMALLSKHGDDWESLEKTCIRLIWDRTKAAMERDSKKSYASEYDWDQLVPVAKFLGIDVKKIAVEAKEAIAPKTAKPRKAQGLTAGTLPDVGTPGVCRVCGCTDDDCSQCVAETGEPCTWVEPDLCSRCVAKAEKKVRRSRAKGKAGV